MMSPSVCGFVAARSSVRTTLDVGTHRRPFPTLCVPYRLPSTPKHLHRPLCAIAAVSLSAHSTLPNFCAPLSRFPALPNRARRCSFAPRPTRATCAVAATLCPFITPPRPTGGPGGVRYRPFRSRQNMICRVVGALLGYGRRLSLPSLLAPSAPLPRLQYPALWLHYRRPSSSVCANALPFVALSRFRRFLFGRGAGRSPLSALLIAAAPSPRGSCSLRSHSHRHAAAERVTFPTVERRVCLCSKAARLHWCLRSRVIKKKVRTT